MSHVIKQQRAYVTRRNDPDNSLFVQQEAAVLAFQQGDDAEMKRRENAAQALKAKRRRAEIKPIAFHIIRELGSRDAIGNMLKARQLEERHGRTTLCLRDYMVSREVTMGTGNNLVFVQGGQASGIESKLHALQQAERAVQAGEHTLPGTEFVKPVTGLVCGHMNLLQAGRIIGGDTTKCKERVRHALRKYLEAAEPFFGSA
jgi:hypothetical protein